MFIDVSFVVNNFTPPPSLGNYGGSLLVARMNTLSVVML